jgi:hypothetical protein
LGLGRFLRTPDTSLLRAPNTYFEPAGNYVHRLHERAIEQAALAVVKSFSNSIDYNTWDAALDALEAVLKEKP